MAGISVSFSLVLKVSSQAPGFTGFKEAWSEVKVILWWGLLVLVLVLDDVLWVQSQWKVQERTKSSKRINQIFTWLLYISAICSAWVASSTFLSSLILINLRRIKQFSHRNYLIWCMFYTYAAIIGSYLGNLRLTPLEGSTMPVAALWTGLIERSAHFTSQTWKGGEIIKNDQNNVDVQSIPGKAQTSGQGWDWSRSCSRPLASRSPCPWRRRHG